MAPRVETRQQLKCRSCGDLVPTATYSYSQKKRKYRRRCPPCVAYFLYLRGDGPKVAKPDNISVEANSPQEYGQIQLAEQLLPPQPLSGVSHLKTIVVERRPHTAESRKTQSHVPLTYQNSTSSVSSSKSSSASSSSSSAKAAASKPSKKADASPKKAAAAASSSKKTDSSASPKKAGSKKVAERDVVEEELKQFEEARTGFTGGKELDVEEASTERFTKLKKTPAKPTHERTPSSSEQARALYMRQLSGRKKMRASRDFDNEEEETPELLKGEKGRKRLSVLEGGYPRPSMKPGKERVIGGN